MAEELKNKGNQAFQAGDHDAAIELFSQAIALTPDNHVLYSNRSAAYASKKEYDKSLADAEKCIALKPDWAKGYGRKGAALHGMEQWVPAKRAFEEGLKLDPNNAQLKQGLESVLAAGESTAAQGINMINEMFRQPNVMTKLAANPKTAAFLVQPDFMEKLKQIQTNPDALGQHISDPRIMQAMGVIMGIDLRTASPEDVANDMEMDNEAAKPPEEPAKKKVADATSSSPAAASAASAAATEEAKAEGGEESTTASPQQRKEALKEKELGTELYKQKKFDEALQHYNRAVELDPEDMTFLSNIGAVYFEMGKFDECIEVCEKAVEVGREHRADYKLIARALARVGNSYWKKEDLENAIKYLQKSMAENRTAEVQAKLKELEKIKETRDRESYLNPEIAEQERQKGNDFFNKNQFAEAVASYTEASRRNPKDAKIFSNRAAAYIKLMAWAEAYGDCNRSLELDPTFVKTYIRKASIEFFQKKYSECLGTLRLAREHDKEGKHTNEILQQEMKCRSSIDPQAALHDPEIQRIVNDPAMRLILEQMQTDPRAIQEHLKNPAVASNLQKLMEAGIIRLA